MSSSTQETTSEDRAEAARVRVRELIAALQPDTVDKRPNKRGAQTRDKLVQAATACFSEYGYTRTRVSDITNRADTAQGNFYRHFTSLDDIFLAALQPALEELAAASATAPRSGDEQHHLVEQTIAYLHSYARNRHLLRVMREAAAASENEGFLKLWLQVRSGFVHRTERWLRRLHESGVIEETDYELHAEALGSMIEQMAYVHIGLLLVTPRPERIQDLGEVIGQIWYRSLAVSSAPASPGRARSL
ncbi:TetR/AcrR family transcriptional regulator [Amycolatopsis sp. DSM 110486]|uniref:TetR/AcrR family transcriptional regulator n=1 Tax=Amycolatopsis sp. DSM 110486 TaxID=2865832 RepID=UPI001C694E62|nr:TetR/AcrR family transcriptional regulator [Amycolatopsis sp. DSM 110486]QYN20923.1 TetR/AcrR family transcriptional regulator [Amycolatopsis sp. DSM 110486]